MKGCSTEGSTHQNTTIIQWMGSVWINDFLLFKLSSVCEQLTHNVEHNDTEVNAIF